MGIKKFNDARVCALLAPAYERIRGTNRRGVRFAPYSVKGLEALMLFDNDLNNLAGSYTLSFDEKLTDKEKATLFRSLTEQSIELGVNYSSLYGGLANIVSVLLENLDKLKEEYDELVTEGLLPPEEHGFSTYVINQLLSSGRNSK